MARQYAKNQPAGFKNHLERIAIVGAGGQIGGWITGELLKNKSLSITAITREGSSNSIPFDIPVTKVNYDDRASLVNALKGHDCLLVTMGVMAPPDTTKKLYEAAAEAGVPWIVPNEYGGDHVNEQAANDNLVGPRKAVERKVIEDLGVSSWVGIACMFWYEYSLGGGTQRYGFDFKEKTLKWFDDGSVKLCTSTFPQTARGTATVLGLKILPDDESDQSPCLDDYRNNFVRISSFRVSQRDMFDSVLRVTGTKPDDWKQTSVKIQDWYAEGKQKMLAGNIQGFGQLLYARVFYPDSPGDSSDRLDNKRLGLPEEDLDEFTKRGVEIGTTGYHEQNLKSIMAGLNETKKQGKEGGYEKLMQDYSDNK